MTNKEVKRPSGFTEIHVGGILLKSRERERDCGSQPWQPNHNALTHCNPTSPGCTLLRMTTAICWYPLNALTLADPLPVIRCINQWSYPATVNQWCQHFNGFALYQ